MEITLYCLWGTVPTLGGTEYFKTMYLSQQAMMDDLPRVQAIPGVTVLGWTTEVVALNPLPQLNATTTSTKNSDPKNDPAPNSGSGGSGLKMF